MAGFLRLQHTGLGGSPGEAVAPRTSTGPTSQDQALPGQFPCWPQRAEIGPKWKPAYRSRNPLPFLLCLLTLSALSLLSS